MATVPYDYVHQPIRSSCLIQQTDSDSFYNPETNGHTGYAFDGALYANGVKSLSPLVEASWFTEGAGPYRGSSAPFPLYGLILLGRANLTIVDASTPSLSLWMTFLLGDGLMLGNNIALGNPNFLSDTMGFLPSGISYANGVVSVIYTPDPGSVTITSSMVISIDFARDTAYADVAV